MEGFESGSGRITSFQIVEGTRRINRYSEEIEHDGLHGYAEILGFRSYIAHLPSSIYRRICSLLDGPPGAGFPSLGGKGIRIPTVRLSWTK